MLKYLFYVKYNKALNDRLDYRDVIGPIELNDIHLSNDWL